MKITLSIATYNRKRVLQAFSSNLKKIIPNNINVRIYDDKSSEYNHEFLKEIFPFATEININSENLRADKNMYFMYKNFISTGDDILIQLDSDMLLNNNFFNIVTDIVREMEKEEAVYSLYNSDCHLYIENGRTKILSEVKFSEKKSIGGACVIFSRKTIEKILENIKIKENNFLYFDWRWSEYLNENKIPIYVSENSYVQHIGYGGQNNFDIDKLDFGKNFIGLSDINDLQFLLSYYEKIFVLQKKRILDLREKYNNMFFFYRLKNKLRKNKYFMIYYKKIKKFLNRK